MADAGAPAAVAATPSAKRSSSEISTSASPPVGADAAVVKKGKASATNPEADEEESAADVSASLMSSLSAEQISSLMSQEGPVVKVVHLKADGTAAEVDADMSPKKATPQALLGGPASFLGQIPDLNLIIMMRREDTTATLAQNQHKLPFPFHATKVNGSLLLVRMDQSNQPQPFTLSEWTTWSTNQLAKPITEEMLQSLKEGGDEDDADGGDGEEEEGDDDEEEDDDDDGGFTPEQQQMLEAAIKKFGDENGRPPTEMELVALMQDDYDSDEDGDYEEGEEGDDDDEEEEDHDEQEDGTAEEQATTEGGQKAATNK